MIPEGLFKSTPSYDANEVFNLVERASHLGFRCFQIDPTSSFTDLEGNRLRNVLDKYGMESNVHIGGLYDAEKFVISQEERNKFQRDLHFGIKLSREASSSCVTTCQMIH